MQSSHWKSAAIPKEDVVAITFEPNKDCPSHIDFLFVAPLVDQLI